MGAGREISMRLPYTVRKKARIEIIPMIDTMFFLLVFFMVATLSMTIQRGLPVNLPAAATAQGDVRDIVSLSVTKEGSLFFNKEPVVTPTDLIARLQAIDPSKLSVVINADREVSHGLIVEVMEAVRKSGVTKMAIATKPKSETS